MGVTPDWDELKEELISVGMKPFLVPTYNTNEFKDVNWDLKEAQEGRADIFIKQYQQMSTECKIKEYMDCIKKMKIMDYVRNEDSTILNNMYGVTLSDSEKEEQTSYTTYNQIIENNHEVFRERYKFAQAISFNIKHIKQARFDILGRYFNVLVNNIGRAIEDCVVKDAHKGIWPTDFRYVGRTIVSPEIHHKYQDCPSSLLLKDNQILTCGIRKNPPYVVIEDMIYFNREHDTIQMTGFVEIAFSEEKFTLYEVDNE